MVVCDFLHQQYHSEATGILTNRYRKNLEGFLLAEVKHGLVCLKGWVYVYTHTHPYIYIYIYTHAPRFIGFFSIGDDELLIGYTVLCFFCSPPLVFYIEIVVISFSSFPEEDDQIIVNLGVLLAHKREIGHYP